MGSLGRPTNTNLKVPTSTLFGREAVLARIDDAFASGTRMVTLLGPPGMGKTRAAHHFAASQRAAYEAHGGAWFCDLSEAKTPAELSHAVASLWSSLREGPLADENADRQIDEHLAARGPMLLVLDNFEQLVASSAQIVRRWSEVAPDLCLLVTSRERLLVPVERVLELEPLRCPREGDLEDAILSCEAVRLFAARVSAIGGDLGHDPAVLGTLVRQLDGIPLAIELAAARARVFPPSELVSRLRERFELLAHHPRETEGRHATLQSAIDWSWNMITVHEQVALAECSVFRGGFTMEAAERVLSAGPGDAPPIVDRVAALRDKSLLHVTEGGRLSLYLSIREYASKKLEDMGTRADEARWRHVRHYAATSHVFSEARTFHGLEPDAALRSQLTADKENLALALALVRARPLASGEEIAALAELGIAATLVHAAPGVACSDALGAALGALDALESTPEARDLVTRILGTRQSLFNSMGRFEESRADLSRLLAMTDLSPGMRALGLVMQGIQLRFQSSYRAAWESHVHAERELEPLALPRMKAMNWACMGRLQCDFGDTQRGRAFNELARSICEENGDRWMEGLVLGNLAQLEQELQNFGLAAHHYEGALQRFRETSEPHYVAVYSEAYGDLCHECGKVDEARQLYARAATFLRGWHAHRNTVMLYAAWGALEARHGTMADAEAHFERARRSAAKCDSATVRLALSLHGAFLDLRRASEAADGPLRLVSAEKEAWRARVRALEEKTGTPEEREVVESSIDVRFALRLLKTALDGEKARPALLLATNAIWFAVSGGARVDLSRRGSLRRILWALSEHHANSPEQALGREALLACGWPQERLLADAASKRLRVAIATLRGFGLKDVLRTQDDGYLLDPRARIEVVSGEA